MKLVAFLGFLAFASTTQAAPIFCGAETSDYAVAVSNDHRSATLTINGETPQFGELVCRPMKNEGQVGQTFLQCHSPFVADAGYAATFRHASGVADSIVHVEESWIGGSYDRATLPCVKAMNF